MWSFISVLCWHICFPSSLPLSGSWLLSDTSGLWSKGLPSFSAFLACLHAGHARHFSFYSPHEENADDCMEDHIDQVVSHRLQLTDSIVPSECQHTQGPVGLMALLLQAVSDKRLPKPMMLLISDTSTEPLREKMLVLAIREHCCEWLLMLRVLGKV